jgi:hypothetical protein
LTNEKLHRYLELEHAAELAYHLVRMMKGSKPLLKTLEVYFIKHRKAVSMNKKIHNWVSYTYSICGCSPTLIAALEDPSIEVPEVDPKMPKMDKVPYGDSKRSALPHDNEKEHKRIAH